MMTMKSRVRTTTCLASALACLLAYCPAQADDQLTFPIIFGSIAELEPFGFSLVKREEKPEDNPWRAKACEDHSSNPKRLLLAVSDEIVAAYERLGFTRKTLCLALAGGPLYDPFSGDRMPSFVMRDSIQIAELLRGRDPDNVDETDLLDAGALTEELPLAVPECFKNGKPHVDCEWRFSERTGVQRTQSMTTAFNKAGQDLLPLMRQAIAKSSPAGFVRAGNFEGKPAGFMFPFDAMTTLVDRQPLTYAWFELDPQLPQGYGYAISPQKADKRPTISAAAILSNISRKKPASQISAERIKAAIARRA